MLTYRGKPQRRFSWRGLTLAAITFAGITGTCSTAALAAPPIYVDGQVSSVPAIVRNQQVFVPVRGVFEKLNAVVNYTPPRAVVARKSNVNLANLSLGSRMATVKGAAHTLETAPFRSGGRIFVPLRLISEAAGATVSYSSAPHAVHITVPRPLVAAVPVVMASAPDTVAPAAQQQGIPWWVWLLLALIVLALLLAFFMRRKEPEPIIKTRSSASDPTIKTRR